MLEPLKEVANLLELFETLTTICFGLYLM